MNIFLPEKRTATMTNQSEKKNPTESKTTTKR